MTKTHKEATRALPSSSFLDAFRRKKGSAAEEDRPDAIQQRLQVGTAAEDGLQLQEAFPKGPWVLSANQAPGFDISPGGERKHMLSPIMQLHAEEHMKTVVLRGERGERSIRCPRWLNVSDANDYVERFEDSTFAAQQYKDTAGHAQLAAMVPAGAPAPVGAKASFIRSKIKTSASSKLAQHFSITATSVKVELDPSQAQYSRLFLDAALNELPVDLSGGLKAVDEKINRFLKSTGRDFECTTYLGGSATGYVETDKRSSGRESSMQAQGQGGLEAAVAEAGFNLLAKREQGKQLSTAMKILELQVSGGNHALQTQGISGRTEWLKSLRQPHASLQLLRGNAIGEQERLPTHYFLQQALLYGKKQPHLSDYKEEDWDKLQRQYMVLLQRWEEICAKASPSTTGIIEEVDSYGAGQRTGEKTVVVSNVGNRSLMVSVEYSDIAWTLDLDMRVNGIRNGVTTHAMPPNLKVRKQGAVLSYGHIHHFELPTACTTASLSCAQLNGNDAPTKLFQDVAVKKGKMYMICH